MPTPNALITLRQSEYESILSDITALQEFIGIALSYKEVSVNYTALLTDYTINVIAEGVTITLPASEGNTGKIFNIKNSTGSIIINPQPTELIDGKVMVKNSVKYTNLSLQCTGSGWIII